MWISAFAGMTTKHQCRHCEEGQSPDEAIYVVEKESLP
jgi:hypothetical protein